MRLSRRALLLAAGAAPLRAIAAEPERVVCPLAVAPATLIPGVSDTLETRLVGSKLYGGLCRIDAGGVPQPDLATWDISPDGLTYVFHLRPDLLWHDSGAVTAADVIFSITQFHRVLQPCLGLKRVAAARAPDARTAVLILDAPFEPFLRQLDALSMPIVPQHVHNRPGFALDARAVMPVGTGPFWLVEWIRLQRFDWFAGPKPELAEIACPIVTDPAARTALLEQAPSLLVGDAVDLAALPRLRGMAAVAVDTQPAGTIAGLQLNHAAKPLDDLRVRQGLASAIDRAVVLREVWLGLGRVATGPVLSASQDRNPAATLPAYDPRAASGLLTEAGLRPDDRGVRLQLSHLLPPGAVWDRLASCLRAMLALVGVDLVPETVTAAEWGRRLAVGDYQTAGFTTAQTGDLTLDLAAYAADVPALRPLLTGAEGDARAKALLDARAMVVGQAARVWLVEPALPVVRDRRLSLPGGVFTDFTMARLSPGPGAGGQGG